MENLELIMKAISEYGIPLIITTLVIVLAIKYIPRFFKLREAERKESAEQFKMLLAVTEQGNSVIERSNQIIAMNTEAIKNNTDVHDKVTSALGRDYSAIKELKGDMKEHDRRAEEINKSVSHIIGKLEG